MNQKGFVTVGVILWAPLFLMMLCFGLWMVWLIHQKHQLSNLCHYQLLKSQQALVDGNNKLLLFNPQAMALITEKKLLNRLIQSAPPKVKALAIMRRKIVIAKQIKLSVLQKSLIKTHRALSKGWASELRVQLHRHLKKKVLFFNKSHNFRARVSVTWSVSRIQVHIRDKASTYKRSFDHSQRQTMKAQWRIPIKALAPHWLQFLLPLKNDWVGFCETHPQKGDRKWYAAIGAGKL